MKPMYILEIFLKVSRLIHLDGWICCKMCPIDFAAFQEKIVWTYLTIFVLVNAPDSVFLPFFEFAGEFSQSAHWVACLLIN